MISDRYMPIDKAAKLCGVSTKTFRRWLEEDGFVFRTAPYQRILVSERDVQAVIEKRSGKRLWSRAQSRKE